MNSIKPQTFTAIALALAAPGMACAQTADSAQNDPPKTRVEAQQDGIEDIVVTAQRREENAQRAALSIDVIGGDALRTAGVSKPDDLSRLAPGLQIGGGTTTQVYVRGVGDFGVTATANPAVATSLDGVAIARPQAISGSFFDIERVELLKGPQGTLYGRNASGGALNLLTVQPRLGEFSGYAEATVGNYDQYGVEGAVNVPGGENGAFRLSFQVNRRDDYLSAGGDDDNHESLRFQSKFAHGALTMRTIMGYTHLGGNGTGLVVIPKLPGTSAWTSNTDPRAGAAYLAAAAAQFAASGGQSPPPFLLANPADSSLFQDIDSYNASLQLDYDLGLGTLTVIPAYRRTESRFAVQPSFLYNVGGVYSANGDRSKGEVSDQYSLEARIGGDTGRLQWVVGGYAFKEDQSVDFALNGGLILNQRVLTDLSTEAIAAFGQLTYGFTDRFRVTGGARYTSDKRSAEDFAKFAISPTVTAADPRTGNPPIPCLPAAGSQVGARCPLTNMTPGFYDSSVKFNKVTWKAGVEFDVGPQSLLFADVSTGFKAGGFNQAVSLADPTTLQPFEPETITAYTLGLKNRFFDNKLQLNFEAFYWDYKDLQLSAQAIDGSGSIVLLTQNAGQAHVTGANVSAVVKPWPGATLRVALEYVDSKYDEFIVQQLARFVGPGRVACSVSAPNAQTIVTVDCSGRQLVRAPKWSGNAGISQVFPLANGGDFTLDADVAFAGERFLATDFIAAELARGYANVSASLTYNAPQDRWFVSGFVRNLTNEAIYTGGGGHQAGFVTGWVTSNIAPPRTYGARLGVRF